MAKATKATAAKARPTKATAPKASPAKAAAAKAPAPKAAGKAPVDKYAQSGAPWWKRGDAPPPPAPGSKVR